MLTFWKLEHLGGFEMMRDGTKTSTFRKHETCLDEFNSYEVFYEIPKETLSNVINDFKSDEDAFNFLKNAWNNRFNNGGGWGHLECKDINGLLDILCQYEFSSFED
jgi:hypothetical protein